MEWERRQEEGDDDWPVTNPFDGAVPVVELGVNRELRPGSFPYARGEFANVTGLLDRINLLTFLGLVVAFWQGFPMRGVIGEKIRREVLRDDDGQALVDEGGKERTKQVPLMEMRPDSLAQIENPNAKTFTWDAADRGNLSIYPELEQVATLTATPRHYVPMEGGMSNLSPEMIAAAEGGMHAAVKTHKGTLGEGWEEVNRLAGEVLGEELSPRASMEWMKHESRSLAEMADAYVKLLGSNGNGLPAAAAAEIALNVTQDQMARWEQEGGASVIVDMLRQAQAPPPVPAPNGNGAVPSGVPAG